MSEKMNKEMAMEKLNEGYYITHEFWEDGEFVYKHEGNFFDEEDGLVDIDKNLSLEDGYLLVESEEEEDQGEEELTLDKAMELMGEPPRGRYGRMIPRDQVMQILALSKLGYSNGQLGKKFKVSLATLNKVLYKRKPYDIYFQ